MSKKRRHASDSSSICTAEMMSCDPCQDAHEFYLYTLSGLTRSSLSGIFEDDPPLAASRRQTPDAVPTLGQQGEPATTMLQMLIKA